MDYDEFMKTPPSQLFGTTTPKGAIYVILAQIIWQANNDADFIQNHVLEDCHECEVENDD